MTVAERIQGFMDSARGGRREFEPDALWHVLRRSGLGRADASRVFEQLTPAELARRPPLQHLELFLTSACNLACRYCFVESRTAARSMSRETACSAIDLLFRESGSARALNITFMGGEPFVRIDTLREAVTHARHMAERNTKTVRFNVTSNATLIDDEVARYCAENSVRVLVSIDGTPEMHDAFRRTSADQPTHDRVMRGVERLQKHQPYLGAKMTIMPEFAHRVDEGVYDLHSRGFAHFIIGHASGTHWPQDRVVAYGDSLERLFAWWRGRPCSRRPKLAFVSDALRATENVRHRFGCRAGRTGIAVSPEGSIFGCSKMLGAKEAQGILPLGDVWCGLSQHRTRALLCGSLPQDRAECRACAHVTNCLGGCYAVNHAMRNDPFAPSECHLMAMGLRLSARIRGHHRGSHSTVQVTGGLFEERS